MGFDSKGKSRIVKNNPILLHEVRLITPDDCPLLLKIKEDYDLVDGNSNFKERAFNTLVTSIIIQERIYFAVTRRSMQSMMARDPNLGIYNQAFSTNSWASLLAAFYNQFEIMEMIHKGNTQTASAFRLKDLEIAEYLIDKGIDPVKQKAETLEFCNKKYKNKGK
jgi:rRNA-processing protein FCF1